jgi:hypothetical protein
MQGQFHARMPWRGWALKNSLDCKISLDTTLTKYILNGCSNGELFRNFGLRRVQWWLGLV